jgi:ParB family chromosome partitioning protein
LTQETVAQRVGRDRTFVTNYLRLLRLPEDIQRLVEENKLSMGHARALLGIDDADKQRQIARGIIDRSLSVRDTERAVKRVVAGGDSNPTVATTSTERVSDANTRAAESKLRRRLGTQVHILPNQSGDGGKIEVQYYNESDLQRLYEIIVGSQNFSGAS